MRRVLISACLLSLSAAIAHGQQPFHAPDGGTNQTMQSIVIVPAPNAPFSATVRTEWTHISPDGSKSTVYNHRTVARDSSGRVFQERRFLTPHGDKEETSISLLQYDDPNRKERYLCYPARQLCERMPLLLPATLPALLPAGPLPSGAGTVTREDLGQKTIESLDATGTREITTYAAGAFGNEKPQPVIRELWYAPRLQLNVVTKRFDPRASAIQNIFVTDLNLSEPNPKLFEPPSGYRIVNTDGLR